MNDELINYVRSNPQLSDDEIVTYFATPNLVRRNGYITAATLGSVWGAERMGQFIRTLEFASQAGSNAAKATLFVLSGTGLDPNDPKSGETAADLIAAKICTRDEVTAVFSISTPKSAEPVTIADVAAARDVVRVESIKVEALAGAEAGYQRVIALWDAWHARGGGDLPTNDEIVKAFTGN